MLKIAQVALLDYESPGGMEVHVMNLAKELNLMGFKVDIVCLKGNEKTKLRFVPFSEFDFHEYDIIHTHGQYGGQNATYRLKGKRIVHTYHGVIVALLLARGAFISLFRRYYSWLIAKEAIGGLFAHSVIAVSDSAKKEATRYYGVFPSKMTVIPNGHSMYNANGSRGEKRKLLRANYGVKKHDFTFLYVGRGEDPVKGINRTLQAFGEINRKYPNVKLILIPGFPEKIYDSVISTGNLFFEDARDFYLLGDVLVNSSYYEGFPVTIPEAMAAGLPIIAPKVGGITEIVKDGMNGILVDKDCQGLVGAMERIYTGNQFRMKLMRNSMETSKEYTWSKIAAKTAKVYREILKTGNKPK
ncbi:MAG TPA: glycosyltransferase family 1 protein [Candidatus Scalindua sp.]|nr:glycosyltransferase family 1 protein [Candidatus Scalindua sp.]